MVFGFRFTREEDKAPARTPEQMHEFLTNLDKSYSTNNLPVKAPLEDGLFIMARDPKCLFSYISLDNRTKDKIRAVYGEETIGNLIIKRAYPLVPSFLIPGKEYPFELKLNNPHPNYYFTEGIESGKKYLAEFRLKGTKTLVSNTVKTPVNYVSFDTSCEFADQRELMLRQSNINF